MNSYEEDFEDDFHSDNDDNSEQEEFKISQNNNHNNIPILKTSSTEHMGNQMDPATSERLKHRWTFLQKFIKLEESPETVCLLDIASSDFTVTTSVQVPDPDSFFSVQTETDPIEYADKYTPSTNIPPAEPDYSRLPAFLKRAADLFERIFAEESAVTCDVDPSVIGLSEHFRIVDTFQSSVLTIHMASTFIFVSLSNCLINVYSRGSLGQVNQLVCQSPVSTMSSWGRFLFCGCQDGSVLIFNAPNDRDIPSFTRNYGSSTREGDYHLSPVVKVEAIDIRADDKAYAASLDLNGVIIFWRIRLPSDDDYGCAWSSPLTMQKVTSFAHDATSFCAIADKTILLLPRRLSVVDRYGVGMKPNFYQTTFSSTHACNPRLIRSLDDKFAVYFDEGYVALYNQNQSACIKYFIVQKYPIVDMSLSPSRIFLTTPKDMLVINLETPNGEQSNIKPWSTDGEQSKDTTFEHITWSPYLYSQNKSRILVHLASSNGNRVEFHSLDYK